MCSEGQVPNGRFNFTPYNFKDVNIISLQIPERTTVMMHVIVLCKLSMVLLSHTRMVSHRGHNCISSTLKILDSALTS